jgi:hypothetical protein
LSAPRLVQFATLTLCVGLGVGGLYRLLAPSSSGPGVAAGERRSTGQQVPTRLQAAAHLARGLGPTSADEAMLAYQNWAGDPDAVVARRLLLATLLKEPNLPVKLSRVLTAIEGDPTPPEQDPLWPFAVESLSSLWTSATASGGMDLMFAEPRPRARRALISSFALLATSERWTELPGDQRQKLTNYFIDMYDAVVSPQKPELERALRHVAGNDVADILLRKGLGSGDQQLDSEREYERNLAQAAALSRP